VNILGALKWTWPTPSVPPILPEVEKLKGTKLICFYGEKETDSLCRDLETRGLKTVVLKGAHHFGGDYDLIAETILREIGQTK
jgi:type IV secretory pathway VirJ component